MIMIAIRSGYFILKELFVESSKVQIFDQKDRPARLIFIKHPNIPSFEE